MLWVNTQLIVFRKERVCVRWLGYVCPVCVFVFVCVHVRQCGYICFMNMYLCVYVFAHMGIGLYIAYVHVYVFAYMKQRE